MVINIYGYFMNFFFVLLNCMVLDSFEDVDYKNYFGEFGFNIFIVIFDIYYNLKIEKCILIFFIYCFVLKYII